jgi:cell division control protein 6
MSDQTLFRDPDLFEFDRLPEVFHYRDAQMEDLAFALAPALGRASPLNTVLRGLPGTGKTTAVRRIFAEVEETTQRVVPAFVPCQTDQTVYTVYSRIYLALFGHLPPESGVSNRRVLGKIAHALIERGAVLIVCLDDADVLVAGGVLQQVLAGILRMHEGWPGARAGVVLTVSDLDLDFARVLNPATISVLRASEVYFPPYTATEVRGILGDRIRAGLYPGVVAPPVLDLLVERTMACGDLRVGIDMVRRAARAAEREGRTAVTEEDVLAAYSLSRHLHLATVVRGLTAGERAVLDAVLAEEREGGPAVSGGVYDHVCEEMGYTVFHERLWKLEALRLVDLYVRPGRGRTREIVVREGVEGVIFPDHEEK